ncbi:S41 family peptidase [Aridibaculum aurantiacum]|uniref:S41 family peptidase n=1 Tax=Aridibaculum aurantiacum TaxID=2810307 RepID=UPI001A9712B9|nr:S41 family peptidase [Aridibaculum aurantiacum]
MKKGYRFFIALVAAASGLASCQKNVDVVATPPASFVPQQTADFKLKDSTLIYSKDIYLWYKQIPTGFDAQQHATPDAIMKALRSYSNEPGFSQPVDRWSFAYKQQDWDNVSSGASLDFGLNVFFLAEGDLRVRHVEPNSPAGRAGIRRGWKIKSINGSSNITTGNANFIVSAIYQSNTANLEFEKPGGVVSTINLTAAAYQDKPVAFDSVYQAGSKKLGYMVFNSFLGDTTQIYNDFRRVFNGFSHRGVNELVVDLRYNGGGYVSVQEKLANYIINSAHNGQLMMTQQFNDKYTRYNSSVSFRKEGSLNLQRVFFIVSNNSASASELLINNLKPYMDVQLVGPSKTFGKPVGYFPIPLYDWYIFPVSFKTVNKNGEGNYYNGFSLNIQTGDGLDKDYGDVAEGAFGAIIQSFNAGTYRSVQPTGREIDPRVENVNRSLDPNSFKGAIGKNRF